MTDRPDVASVLQNVVVGLLTGTLTALDGSAVPVLDNVPESQGGPAYPYVTVGDDQVVPDAAEGFEDSVAITSTIHVWSARVGRTENKAIVGQVKSRLMANCPLDLGPGWVCVEMLAQGSHVTEDEDGTTTHGIVTFKILADPA